MWSSIEQKISFTLDVDFHSDSALTCILLCHETNKALDPLKLTPHFP